MDHKSIKEKISFLPDVIVHRRILLPMDEKEVVVVATAASYYGWQNLVAASALSGSRTNARFWGKKWELFCCCLLRREVEEEKSLGTKMGKFGFFFFHVIVCFCSAITFLVCVVMVVDLVEMAVTLLYGANWFQLWFTQL